jgi:hypothetical protein
LKGDVKLPRDGGQTNGWVLEVYEIAFICSLLVVCWCLFPSIGPFQAALIAFAGAACIAIVEFFVFNLAPSNWVGAFLYVSIIEFAGINRRLVTLVFRFWKGLKRTGGLAS